MTRNCLIYGAGGFGREVAWLLRDYHLEHGELGPLGFVDDDTRLLGTALNDLPVMRWETAQREYPGAPMVLAFGSPETRAAVISHRGDVGFWFPKVVHPSVRKSDYVSIGDGTVICAHSILTTDIIIGKHTHINLSCTIGHDVIVGDFCTVSPGAHLSGWVHLGNQVFVGSGAVFINGTQNEPLVIGEGAIIGAGAVVTRSVAAGETVVGIPAKPIEKKA